MDNTTIYVLYNESLSYYITYTLISVLGAISSSATLFVLHRSQLKIKRNIIIFNWALCDLIFLCTELSKFALFVRPSPIYVTDKIFCAVYIIHLVTQTGVVTFNFMLFVDKFYDNLNVTLLQSVVPAVWVTMVLVTLISGLTCRSLVVEYMEYIVDIALMILMGTFIIKSIIYLKRRILKKPRNTQLRSVLSSSYILLWLVASLCSLFLNLLPFNDSIEYQKIFVAIAYSHSNIMLIILVCCDDDFKMDLKRLMCGKSTQPNNVQ